MYYGLRHGYVRFGTVQHKLLMLMIGQDHVSHRSIRDDFLALYPDTPNLNSVLGNCFVRLFRHGRNKPWKFIYKVGRERDSEGRSYGLYSLYPLRNSNARPAIPKLSSYERCLRYRTRKKLRVNSVFNFRGTLRVQEGTKDGPHA